jgi:hypothetical protein
VAQPEKLVRLLWQRMAEIYGHRWVSSYGDDAGKSTGKTWARGLAGLQPEQIANGIEAALISAEPWPPTLPEFRAMCLSVPTFAGVRAAIDSKSTSPFVRQVWMYLDSYRFSRACQDLADRLLRSAYELAREHVMRGGALPQESAGELSAPAKEVRTPATDETVRKSMADIEAALGGGEVGAE